MGTRVRVSHRRARSLETPQGAVVFGFLAGVSMLTGIAFGLLPTLRATRVDLASAMRATGRNVIGSRTLLSNGLVVMQVAMALVLLVGAGLFLRTLENLKRVDVGFDSRNLLIFNANPRVSGYDLERASRLFHQVLDRMATMPGVRSAALTRAPLLSATTFMGPTWKQGQASQAPAVNTMFKMDVSPAFFSTMGIPMLQGRSFTDRDGPTGPQVAILNEAAARTMFPDGDALGRRIGESFEKSGEFEVVGMVRDTKYASVRDPSPPTMYRCVWQSTQRNLYVVLRTAGEPLAMSETVRAAMPEIDPTLPVQEFTSQSEHISQRFAQERLFARVYAAFGALAVLLACKTWHRREAEEKLGATSISGFHDTTLPIGSVPLPVSRSTSAGSSRPSWRTRPHRTARNLSAIALVSSLAALVLTVDTNAL